MVNKVVGMWRPESIRATVNGQTVDPFGPRPTGMLCFHESMHFVELMSDPSVPRFSSGARETGTDEENKAVVIGNLALFGTYSVDEEGNLTGDAVQGCTFPNWIGDRRTGGQIKATVEGDTMTEVFQNGDMRVDIVWKRVTADRDRATR
jgi:hypothetical protein